MDQNRIKRNQMLGAKIVKELTARNMEAYYTDSKEEALKKALELIPEGSSISWGGSMSVNEIGLKEAVCQGNYQVYNRDTAPTPEDKRKIELAAYDCDYFLTSANAITEDGIMINIDGLTRPHLPPISSPKLLSRRTSLSTISLVYTNFWPISTINL